MSWILSVIGPMKCGMLFMGSSSVLASSEVAEEGEGKGEGKGVELARNCKVCTPFNRSSLMSPVAAAAACAMRVLPSYSRTPSTVRTHSSFVSENVNCGVSSSVYEPVN